jgi:hypothetical protein
MEVELPIVSRGYNNFRARRTVCLSALSDVFVAVPAFKLPVFESPIGSPRFPLVTSSLFSTLLPLSVPHLPYCTPCYLVYLASIFQCSIQVGPLGAYVSILRRYL